MGNNNNYNISMKSGKVKTKKYNPNKKNKGYYKAVGEVKQREEDKEENICL